MPEKIITHIEGLEKAKSYCAYQERCHKEVVDKLYSWKLNEDEINYVVEHLISDDFLNEERFAIAFVGGKFRIKKWGKRKIIQKLKEKKISDYCIKKGLKEIDDVVYFNTMQSIIDKKFTSLKDRNIFTKKRKTANFLYAKGYESDLVWEYINASY